LQKNRQMKDDQPIYLLNVRAPTRLLVVSENQELCLFLQSEINRKFLQSSLQVDFCYTSLNRSPQSMIEFGASKIDVKDNATIERIIANYDLVFSLHCKQIFPKRLVEGISCINFHPGFNPHNRGWFPQVFSLINGLPVGATVHLMDAEVDHGSIIAQKPVNIEPSDTSFEVYRKIIEAEKVLISENITSIVEGTYSSFNPASEGNFNNFRDFQKLCRLQLDSVDTLQNHINLLRATSHGDFRNAFFLDKKNRKYFVKILIEPE
jgi:dTDP-4-amino-4,6-dideoxyglucose formyltransferase